MIIDAIAAVVPDYDELFSPDEIRSLIYRIELAESCVDDIVQIASERRQPGRATTMTHIEVGTRIEFAETGAMMTVTAVRDGGFSYHWANSWTEYRQSTASLEYDIRVGRARILPAPNHCCVICGDTSRNLTCPRCMRMLNYADRVNAEFTGWQGRDAVMRSRITEVEYVVSPDDIERNFPLLSVDDLNDALSDAAFERWGRPSYADVRAELDARRR